MQIIHGLITVFFVYELHDELILDFFPAKKVKKVGICQLIKAFAVLLVRRVKVGKIISRK